MATYVISDLHGCKEEFDRMLDLIHFNVYDTMWIIGDVCDRGKYPIPLLKEIMSYDNMHLIFGNHDVWLLRYCQELIDAKKCDSNIHMTNDLLCWLHDNGGYITADQYMDLSFPECYDIKLYLENKILFQRLKIHDKKFLLLHAGLSEEYMYPDVDLRHVPSSILVWSHPDIDANPFVDETLIVGHVPTFLYGKQYENKILFSKDKRTIHIDCGCVYGRSLGCLRLEDMQEFYVPSTYPYIPVK